MFPSPIGELHFSINYKGCKSNGIVSVPYRGATFLNDYLNITDDDFCSKFPSPIGELHFSISNNMVNKKMVPGFRPLSGSYISQWSRETIEQQNHIVSVPYRGATFLNTVETFYRKEARKMFPSPIGELHFSIKGYYHVLRLCKVFPSPIGELHFSICFKICLTGYKIQFPSPIGELHFSII